MQAGTDVARDFDSKIFIEYHYFIFEHLVYDLEVKIILVQLSLRFSFAFLSFSYLVNYFDRLPLHADWFIESGF